MKTKSSLSNLFGLKRTFGSNVSTIFILMTFFILRPLPSALSQIPQGFNYQAIARDGDGNLITSSFSIKVEIQNLAADTIFWIEEHNVTPNEYGLISFIVGQGTPLGGRYCNDFEDIDWASRPRYLKTSANTGGGYTEMGTTQIWAVPYSLVAKKVDGPIRKLEIGGASILPDSILFEVKNNDDQTVFAIYNEGVRIYVDDGVKGPKGGFTIGGFGSAKTPSQEYLRVTGDSTRIYVNENAKGPKGGFAIGGFASKADVVNYMNITPLNYFIGHESGMGLKNGQYNTIFGYQAGKALTNGSSNIFIGQTAGLRDTLGGNNIFMGNGSGYYNRIGNYNIFIGNQSGYRNEEGTHNTYIGYQSGYYGGYLTTDPSYNTFVGYQSGLNNRTGQYNTFIGHKAGRSGSSASGDRNVFVGDSAGYSNISGNDNVFIGKAAGQGNTAGDYNVILGSKAGYYNNGDYNVFIGYESGFHNISGADARYGNLNTFIGYQAGRANTIGWHNLAIGYQAGLINQEATNQFFIGDHSGEQLTDGVNNTFVGHLTGSKSTNCSENTFIGYQAGHNNIIGDGNTYIGNAAGIGATGSGNVFIGNRVGWSATGDNELYIDNYSSDTLIYGDFTNGSEKVVINGRLGIGMLATTTRFAIAGLATTSSGTYLRIYNNHVYTQSSSRETKKDIAPLSEDFSKILNAQPVSFTDIATGEKCIGYIAEDFDEMGLNNLVVYKDGKPISLSYELVSLYNLEIIKEQQKKLESQQQQIDELKEMLNEMEKEIVSLRSQ
jgi:hypothetical protein